MVCSGGWTTEAVSHFAEALGPGRGVRSRLRPSGGAMMSWGRRDAGSVSKTQARVAVRLRCGLSPGASRVRIARRAVWCALRVAGRRASGRITMPLPSTCSTSRVSAVAGSAIRCR